MKKFYSEVKMHIKVVLNILQYKPELHLVSVTRAQTGLLILPIKVGHLVQIGAGGCAAEGKYGTFCKGSSNFPRATMEIKTIPAEIIPATYKEQCLQEINLRLYLFFNISSCTLHFFRNKETCQNDIVFRCVWTIITYFS